jgi:hypothetical protein
MKELPSMHRSSEKSTKSFPMWGVESNIELVRNTCSKCPGFKYFSTGEFREHCKTNWHIYNSRPGHEKLSFEEWSVRDESDTDASGSETSTDSEPQIPSSKLILDGIPYHRVGETSLAIPSVIPDITMLVNAKFVAVLILRSGRFAGAIWDSSNCVIVHTCIKRYTVRRKNGGIQSRNDNAKGSPANSIGAQIRRSQEQKLDEDVHDIVCMKWKQYLEKDDCIVFAYASKNQNQSLFVGPLSCPHGRKIFHVPMSVRDPTYAEVCRIYTTMTRVGMEIS